MKKRKSIYKIYSISVWIFFLELCLILASFRKLRNLFPPPEISKEGIVGYTHYFGYPFYFETIVFSVVTFSPFIIVPVIKVLINKRWIK